MNRDAADDKLEELLNHECHIRRYHIEDSGDEIRRFNKACSHAAAELEALFNDEAVRGDDGAAEEYSIQLECITDEKFLNNVYDMISDQMVNAEFAVAQVADILSQAMEPTEELIGMRGVSERVIRILLGLI